MSGERCGDMIEPLAKMTCDRPLGHGSRWHRSGDMWWTDGVNVDGVPIELQNFPPGDDVPDDRLMDDPRTATRVRELLTAFGTSLEKLGIAPESINRFVHVAGFNTPGCVTITHSGGEVTIHDRMISLSVKNEDGTFHPTREGDG